jgi:hypothetical protein
MRAIILPVMMMYSRISVRRKIFLALRSFLEGIFFDLIQKYQLEVDAMVLKSFRSGIGLFYPTLFLESQFLPDA